MRTPHVRMLVLTTMLMMIMVVDMLLAAIGQAINRASTSRSLNECTGTERESQVERERERERNREQAMGRQIGRSERGQGW